MVLGGHEAERQNYNVIHLAQVILKFPGREFCDLKEAYWLQQIGAEMEIQSHARSGSLPAAKIGQAGF